MTKDGSDEAKNNRCYADVDRPVAKLVDGTTPHDGRPEEIELLLNGKSPERTDAEDVKDPGEVSDKQRGEYDVFARARDEEKDAEKQNMEEGREGEGTLQE